MTKTRHRRIDLSDTKIRTMFANAGLDQPPAYMPDEATMIWNTSWPQTIKAYESDGPDWIYLTAPIYALALTNFDDKVSNENMNTKQWQERYSSYVKIMIERLEVNK